MCDTIHTCVLVTTQKMSQIQLAVGNTGLGEICTAFKSSHNIKRKSVMVRFGEGVGVELTT